MPNNQAQSSSRQQVNTLKQMHIWSEGFYPIGFTTKCRSLQANLILGNVIIKFPNVCLSVCLSFRLSVCLRHTETLNITTLPPTSSPQSYTHTVWHGQGVNATSHPSLPCPPKARLRSSAKQTQIRAEAAVSAHETVFGNNNVTPDVGCQQLR